MRIRRLDQSGCRAKTRRLALTSTLFFLYGITVRAAVGAETGVASRDLKIPPPPPPRQPTTKTSGETASNTFINGKIPPPPPKKQDIQGESKSVEQYPRRVPPPPPPRNQPPKDADVSEGDLAARRLVQRNVPPPPPKAKPTPPQIPKFSIKDNGREGVHDESHEEVQASVIPSQCIAEDFATSEFHDPRSQTHKDHPSNRPTIDNKEAELEVEAKVEIKDEDLRRSEEQLLESTPSGIEQPKPYFIEDPQASTNTKELSLLSRDRFQADRGQGQLPPSPRSSYSNQWSTTAYDGPAYGQPGMTPPQGATSGSATTVNSSRTQQSTAYQHGAQKDTYNSYQSQQTNPSHGRGPITGNNPPQRAYAQSRGNQHRHPVQQQRPRQAKTSGSIVSASLKAIWGKVGQGLDSLANVEDVVTGRAQKLLSRVSSHSQQDLSEVDTKSWAARERKAKMIVPTKTPLTPYGQKYEVAKRQQEEASKAVQPETSDAPLRKAPWNDPTTGRMIRANGGASSPDGQHPMPPSGGDATTTGLTATTPNVNPETINSHDKTQSTQYVANPYLQSSNLKTPPKPASTLSDPHSRSARIPWDSSPSPTRGFPAAVKTPPRRESLPARSDDEDKPSLVSKMMKFVPSVKMPNPARIFRFGKKSSYEYATMDAWRDDDEDDRKGGGFFGLFRKQPKQRVIAKLAPRSSLKNGEAMAPPLKSIMARCNQGKSHSLLSSSDEAQCRTVGRRQAFFDGLCILFILLAVQQVDGLSTISLPMSFNELTSNTLPILGSLLKNAATSWAPIFGGYAYLALAIKRNLLSTHVQGLATAVGSKVEDESQYAQLYLRLAAAIRMDPSLPAFLGQAAASQVNSLVATARLNSFVTMMLGCLILMTMSFIGPCFAAVGKSIAQVILLEELRSWPLAWSRLGHNVQSIFRSLGLTLESHLACALTAFLENPLQFAFQVSIFVSAVLATMVPGIEKRKKVTVVKDDDDDVVLSPGDSAQQFAKLGSSSATRLTMLSENGSIENALERWRNTRATPHNEGSRGLILRRIRMVLYTLLVAIIATLPIAVSYLVGMKFDASVSHIGIQWDSILDVSIVLVGVFMVAKNAIQNVVAVGHSRGRVTAFLTLLSNTLEEIRETNRRHADLQFMASVSPTAGLVVKDLWAAHTTKRAWAVRGASLQCKNGEILAVLGDDGAGKTRMLTAIAESLISPPRRSLTSNKVRGYVGIGGIDGSKWDKAILKRRMGVLLSDVRSVADSANLYSGWSMEEVLEPVDGLRSYDTEHKLTSSEKASILLALKISGLYSTLIPRLPSKLSTVLTANEEDLRPSALRPRSHVLSPAEWSKLIFAKVLAQTIYDNDNAAASTDKIENCLVGSVLLLDDPTVLLAEVEEAKILKELRQTGAATVLATNKWATGRFADHIVVVRDGSIVESGTHNELISRGPQQSLYAAKWHAMTMQ